MVVSAIINGMSEKFIETAAHTATVTILIGIALALRWVDAEFGREALYWTSGAIVAGSFATALVLDRPRRR